MFLNIAAYQFALLSDLSTMRLDLLDYTKTHDLKGTILISPEGINAFVSGQEGIIRELLMRIRSYPGLENFTPKESYSDTQPFSRMLVKIKKEIISFGVPQANPLHIHTKRISAQELKRWYDEQRDFILLDTRNDFEIEIGAFKNTTNLKLHSFKDFIQAIEKKLPEWRNKPIVTVCTGGIRCEKAAPFMNLLGFTRVYQLNGGILKYFEAYGSKHYNGDCFVFDKRVALNPELKPSGHAQCFNCQTVLSNENVSCPTC